MAPTFLRKLKMLAEASYTQFRAPTYTEITGNVRMRDLSDSSKLVLVDSDDGKYRIGWVTKNPTLNDGTHVRISYKPGFPPLLFAPDRGKDSIYLLSRVPKIKRISMT